MTYVYDRCLKIPLEESNKRDREGMYLKIVDNLRL